MRLERGLYRHVERTREPDDTRDDARDEPSLQAGLLGAELLERQRSVGEVSALAEEPGEVDEAHLTLPRSLPESSDGIKGTGTARYRSRIRPRFILTRVPSGRRHVCWNRSAQQQVARQRERQPDRPRSGG